MFITNLLVAGNTYNYTSTTVVTISEFGIT